MRDVRSIAGWILLATFVAGGLAGPSLHRVQHAMDRMARADDAPCHGPEVHESEVPLWTEASGQIDVQECDVCARRLLLVPPVFGSFSEPIVAGAVQIESLSHLTIDRTATDQFIRGPPFALGVRLS
jgi:hypothetical protein